MTALQVSVALNIAQVVVLAWAVEALDKSVTLNRRLLGFAEYIPFLQRVRTWLTHRMASNAGPRPSPAHGDSPPSPPLNCHVASQRPVPAPRSRSFRTRPGGSSDSISGSSPQTRRSR